MMEQITAFKCDFCNKVYSNKQTCKAHEIKCYRNPDTKSCSTCAFLNNDNFLHPNGTFIGFKGCLLNNNLSLSLRTNCLDHKDDSYKDDIKIMFVPIRGYKHMDSVYNYLRPRTKLTTEMSKVFI
jgi:hypothetical protein